MSKRDARNLENECLKGPFHKILFDSDVFSWFRNGWDAFLAPGLGQKVPKNKILENSPRPILNPGHSVL